MAETMIERIAEALLAQPDKEFISRRMLDKSGYEVICDTNPTGSLADETMHQILMSTDAQWCEDQAALLTIREDAIRVLTAMREPTEAMLRHGSFAFGHRGEGSLHEAWEFMIDAALSEASTTESQPTPIV